MRRWERYLSQLSRQHMPRWYGWAYAVTGDGDQAVALVDDAVTRSLTWPARSFETALHRTQSRVVRTLVRQRHGPSPEHLADVSPSHRAFLDLPARTRVAMVLHAYEGLSPVRVATLLDCETTDVVADLSAAADHWGDDASTWGLDPSLYSAVDGVTVSLVTRSESV